MCCLDMIWLQQLRTDLQVRETQLREEMEAENRRLMEELSRCQDLLHEGEGQVRTSLLILNVHEQSLV